MLPAGGQQLQRADDAVGHRVTGGDAAEHVDEDALDLRVGDDDLEPVGHDLRGGAAADVEEVGGLDAAVGLSGAGDHVEGAHDEAGAVADDADRAVELDVVEALGLGCGLQRVLGGGVDEVGVAGVAEAGVLVQGHLAVQRDDVTGAGGHERVDLDEGGVLGDEHGPQLLQDVRDLAGELTLETAGGGDLGGFGGVHPLQRVDGHPRQGLGPLDGELLDLHAALRAGHGEVGPVGAVQQEGDVVLLGDVRSLRDHDPVHGVALDVHAEDGVGVRLGLVGGVRQLDPAGLAAAADLDLGLDDDGAADPLRGGSGFGRGGGHRAGEDGYAVCLEHVSCLVLVEVHVSVLVVGGCAGGPDRPYRRSGCRPSDATCESVSDALDVQTPEGPMAPGDGSAACSLSSTKSTCVSVSPMFSPWWS